MPGRSSTNSGSTRYISFSGVESALSSLKNFQSCIISGMDTVSSVALDLVETQRQNFRKQLGHGESCSTESDLQVERITEVSSEYSMEKAMVEFAKMDRELNHYVKAIQSTINHEHCLEVAISRGKSTNFGNLLIIHLALGCIYFCAYCQSEHEIKVLSFPMYYVMRNTGMAVKEERPEKVPDLKLLVEKKFLALQDKNSDTDFKDNEKFVQFKQQLRELKKQYGMHADRENDGTEGVDEDMIVTQSQTNFICPITQLEMKKPVKNKMCGHTYEEEAIVRMIESKHKRKKKACCPKIGCSHTDMRMSDLIPDEALRRAIENHNKKKRRHTE